MANVRYDVSDTPPGYESVVVKTRLGATVTTYNSGGSPAVPSQSGTTLTFYADPANAPYFAVFDLDSWGKRIPAVQTTGIRVANLPTPEPGDAGKVLTVKTTEDGYELGAGGGGGGGPATLPTYPLGGFTAQITAATSVAANYSPSLQVPLTSAQDFPGTTSCCDIDSGNYVRFTVDGLYAITWTVQFANDAANPEMVLLFQTETGDWVFNNNFQVNTKSRTHSFSRTMPIKANERIMCTVGNGGASATTVGGFVDVVKLL